MVWDFKKKPVVKIDWGGGGGGGGETQDWYLTTWAEQLFVEDLVGLEKCPVNFVKMLTDDGAVGWWWLILVLLDHVYLPWHCSDNRVVVVFQVFPQLFACLGFSVSRNTLQLLLPSICSSLFSGYQLVIGILPVHCYIMDIRISHPHQDVAANGSRHNGRGYIWLKFYGSE